jgi:hypothetical protein
MIGFDPNKITSSKAEKMESSSKLDPQELFELAKQEADLVEIKSEDRNSEGKLLASPGGPESNLSEEYWKLVRTPSFKKWFGDSNVVDENGEPALLYHKTFSDLERFNAFSKEVGQGRGPGHYLSSGDHKLGNNRLSVFTNAKVEMVDKFSKIHRFSEQDKQQITSRGFGGVAYLENSAKSELDQLKNDFRRNYSPETLKDYIYYGFGKLKGLISGPVGSSQEELDYLQEKQQFLGTLDNPFYQIVIFDDNQIMIVNKEEDYRRI